MKLLIKQELIALLLANDYTHTVINGILFFFIMNVVAVIMLIFSLTGLEENKHKMVISSIFSLYTIITQYAYNNLNYRERALKFHYIELEIEAQILALKSLARNTSNHCEEFLENMFDSVMKQYICTLKGYENHDDVDNKKRLLQKSSPSLDFYFFIITLIALLIFISLYIFL
ncbi:SLATT domain-containing protein [Streptococcus suis]|uniref:SLATT domain-containing protein n=1 Tax=Streptococcus suis TaxID=1307 RepID=UPI000697364B|nr:SLATT domain-containing protein [Streptococcus suis]